MDFYTWVSVIYKAEFEIKEKISINGKQSTGKRAQNINLFCAFLCFFEYNLIIVV